MLRILKGNHLVVVISANCITVFAICLADWRIRCGERLPSRTHGRANCSKIPKLFCATQLWLMILIIVAISSDSVCCEADDQILWAEEALFQMGDDLTWSAQEFDDSRWTQVSFPHIWDKAGISWNQTMGWYRIHFEISGEMSGKALGIDLGLISDADQVWLNGVRIGGLGRIGEYSASAATVRRLYQVPSDLLQVDDNVLAVRVQRRYYSGGILSKTEGRMTPLIADYHQLLLDRQKAEQGLYLIFVVLATIWIAGVMLGFAFLHDPVLWKSHVCLILFMLIALATYSSELPCVVRSQYWGPTFQFIVNTLLSIASWAFLILIAGLLQQTVSRWQHQLGLLASIPLLFVTVFNLFDYRVFIMLTCLMSIVLMSFGTICMCYTAIRQRVIGAYILSASVLTMLLIFARQVFQTVYFGQQPLDAYSLALFVIVSFVVLLMRFHNLTRRSNQLAHDLLEVHETERRRISREMHDSVSQSLTAMKLSLQQFHHKLECGDNVLPLEIETVISGMRHVGEDLRRLVHGLRPLALESLEFIDAIRQLTEESEEQCDLTIALHGPLEMQLSDKVKDHLYKIVQEIIHNTVKHACASQLTIELSIHSNGLIMRCRDDGIGFEPAQLEQNQGIGLLTIRERCYLLGGTVVINSRAGQGTVIELNIPIENS